ncbi:MAG: oligosaccharide flippase family protein [Oscillospiraceae bacterium]|nr:oligosaccharide flippase family protein [Oscillospiraceae bacterium]
MTHSRHNRNYLHGAAILAAAVVIVRVIGAVYRIPMAIILGDEGNSPFAVAHSIYQFLLIVSTAGLPVALSKMVASADAMGRPRQVRRVFVVGRNTFVILGAVSFLIMAGLHRQLADLFGSPSAAYGILALSPAVFLVGLISAYRGYCQGLSDMVPTSVSQVLEAFARLVIGIGLAWILASRGFSVPITAAGAIFGVTAGTGIAAAYLFFAKRRVDRRHHVADTLDTPDSNRRIFQNLKDIAIPLTLGSSILSLMTIVNNAVILRRLQFAVGLPYAETQSLHGTFSMALPLFHLPSAFVIPITVALIPAISGLLAQGDQLGAKKNSESGIRITCLLALPAGAGLTVLAGPIMDVIYYGRFNAEYGAGLLAWLGIAVFFICFFQVTNCVLQAYGFQRYTLYTLPIGGAISVGLTWLLIADPRFLIYGAAIGILVCYVVISAMNVVLVKRSIPDPPSFLRAVTRPLLCTLVMAATAWASYGLISGVVANVLGDVSGRLPIAISLTGAIGIAMLVYLVLIIATRALTKEDMHMLPKGEKLAKVLRVR